MKGRKPTQTNVVPLKSDGDTRSLEERSLETAKSLRPRGISPAHRKLWDEIALELAKAQRLKPLYVHVVQEYVASLDRLRTLRKYLADHGETYEITGRNGKQIKNRAEVGQYNEERRMWLSLSDRLGLSPSAERGMTSAMGDLFDDPAREFVG